MPMNSPTIAMKWFLGLLGRKPRNGILNSFLCFPLSPLLGLERKPGRFRPDDLGALMFMVVEEGSVCRWTLDGASAVRVSFVTLGEAVWKDLVELAGDDVVAMFLWMCGRW